MRGILVFPHHNGSNYGIIKRNITEVEYFGIQITSLNPEYTGHFASRILQSITIVTNTKQPFSPPRIHDFRTKIVEFRIPKYFPAVFT